MLGALIYILLGVGGDAHVDLYSGNQCDSMGLLLERTVADTKGPDGVYVDRDGHYLYFTQVKGLR